MRDAGVDAAGQAWIAEPWAAGETLAERVARTGPLAADQLLVVAEALLAGLSAAHARGICDGAITPERLRISGDGVPRVTLITPAWPRWSWISCPIRSSRPQRAAPPRSRRISSARRRRSASRPPA
ncbi:MAG: hypothetical protein R3F60_34005 [bacterium]